MSFGAYDESIFETVISILVVTSGIFVRCPLTLGSLQASFMLFLLLANGGYWLVIKLLIAERYISSLVEDKCCSNVISSFSYQSAEMFS